MKKLIYITLIIGILSACTKSGVQYERTGEISFRPVAAKPTKSAVTGTEYPKDQAHNFRVWSWWGDVPAGTSLNDFPTYAEMYINKGEFTNKSSNNWGGVTPYYWPTKGSLMFAGYSPADAQAINFSYSWTNQAMTIDTYTQSSDISKTHDLMWFDVTERSYIENTNSDGDEMSGVPVVFKHLLSWLTFKFQLKEGILSTYIITDVKLKNIETEADFYSKPSGLQSEWMDHYMTSDVAIWSGKQKISSEPIVLESTKNGIIVIPQSCAAENAQLEITYKTNDSGPSQIKTVYLTAGADGNEWKLAKHYTYTMTFGSNEILVMPEVNDWNTVSVDIVVH